MSETQVHTLHGLEPDNLLAFLALLGALRALAAAAPALHARASWTVDAPPLRPRLHVGQGLTQPELIEKLVEGADALARDHDFAGRADIDFTAEQCRSALTEAAQAASISGRTRADLLASLVNDCAVKEGKEDRIEATPLCLLFGQGHQHFLQRLAEVPRTPAPPPRGHGKAATQVTAAACLSEALFSRWQRDDPTKSFRWDPAEDVRYATMACDPTDPAFKGGTQHGANRLGALGLGALPLVAEHRMGRMRPAMLGGARDSDGFSFAWPIWREPATLRAVGALLSHPVLRVPGALSHLGIEQVMVARRISVGKFMNFTRARPVA